MDDSDLAWTTLESDVAYSCPGFEVIREIIRLPDGTETDFDYLSEPPTVVVLPLIDGGGVVTIEEWREAVDRCNRGLPAGTVEPDDDDLHEAARRELREETGYEAETIDHLLTVEPANGVANTVHHYFVANGCEPGAEQNLDDDEQIRVVPIPFDALRSAALDGSLRDGRAVLAVCYYELTTGRADTDDSVTCGSGSGTQS